jgi:uncharacterized membrane protein
MLRSLMLYALAASIALGAIMTIGDWTWAVLGLRHRMAYGLIHGAVMCLCLGAAIGIRERKTAAGVIAGPIIGLIAAAAFYALAPSLRLWAMFPSWMLFWILFALLRARLRAASIGSALLVGIVAAVLSGLAFYSISGIWTRHDPGGPNYAWNLVAWSFAFFPGFATLFWKR